MSDYPYRASVVVPVYNVEKYLAGCIDSLLNQTIAFSELQVLLINDGSKDGSEAICKDYADKYENIFLYSKENEGLSKTRNFGRSKAEGKYIFYLDSDDTLAPDTVKSVCDFFDTVYDEVDLVTYKIIQYYNGRPIIVHYRYMTLIKSGVYDLNEPDNRFIAQTNINICVKNTGGNNISFDTTPNFRHEDEKYCCDILCRKMKIGYCADGEYIYNRNNVDSIVSSQFSPENIFETSMQFYEELFSSYKGRVAPYFQGIVFNDFRWTLTDGKFLPTHLDGEEWEKANRRIDYLLSRMDADAILLHPSVSASDMFYWLKRRGGCTVVNTADSLGICCEGRVIYNEKKIKVQKTEDADKVTLTLKSPVFNYLKKSQIEIKKDGKPIDFTFNEKHTDKASCEPGSFYPSFSVNTAEAAASKFTVSINSIEYKI